MAEDRLQDLLGGAGAPGDGPVVAAEIEPSPPAGLAEFQEVKVILDAVGQSIERLQQAYATLPHAVFDKDDLENQLGMHTEDAQEGLGTAKLKMEATKKALDARLENSGQQQPASHRMRHKGWMANNVQLSALTGRLLDVQERGLQQRKADARRQHRIAMPDATEEQIDEALAAGAVNFAQIQASTAEAARELTMAEKHAQQLQLLEAAIDALWVQQLTLADIVEQSGALFDNIEANVDACNEYVNQSVAEYLPEAIEHAQSARKKQAGTRGPLCCARACCFEEPSLLADPPGVRCLQQR